jgi:hypothetical protein
MIYVKSIVAGLACVCVASFLTLEAISIYLSVVYHVKLSLWAGIQVSL